MQIECFICHNAPAICKHKQTLFVDMEQSQPPYYLFVAQRGLLKDEYKGEVVDSDPSNQKDIIE